MVIIRQKECRVLRVMNTAPCADTWAFRLQRVKHVLVKETGSVLPYKGTRPID
jgi:hypothetical protein